MCKRRFLRHWYLRANLSAFLRTRTLGRTGPKKYWQSLTTSMLFVLKSFIKSLLYVKFNFCEVRTARGRINSLRDPAGKQTNADENITSLVERVKRVLCRTIRYRFATRWSNNNNNNNNNRIPIAPYAGKQVESVFSKSLIEQKSYKSGF